MKHNVCLIEYEKQYGRLKKYTEKKVALFDGDTISEEEVNKAIMEDDAYHRDIIFCSKEQYLSVFSSMIGKKKENE